MNWLASCLPPPGMAVRFMDIVVPSLGLSWYFPGLGGSISGPSLRHCEAPVWPASFEPRGRHLSGRLFSEIAAGSCSLAPVQPPLGSCAAAGRTLSFLGRQRPPAAPCALAEAGLCNICAALQVTAGQPAFTEVFGGLTATNIMLPAAELAISAVTAENKAQPGWDEALGVRGPACQCL